MTGIGVLTPIGLGTEAFARGLRAGASGIRRITAFDPGAYRTQIGGQLDGFEPEAIFGARDRRHLDRASMMALTAAIEALEEAEITTPAARPDRWGAVLGTTLGGMISGERFHRLLFVQGKRRPSRLRDFPLHAATDRLCSTFAIEGPSFTVSSACASGAQAIACAFDLIRSDEVDVALAGGVDTLAQLTHAGFDSLRLLVPEPEQIRPFDRRRAGFALGEAACVLVLEERLHADARGAKALAEIRGFGTSNDAYHMAAPRPDGSGSARAIQSALQASGLPGSRIGYINAHGTATQQNDASEAMAILSVFGGPAECPPVSSTKPMTGHTLGAAGAIECAAAILAIRDSFLPPTLNYGEPDPACPVDCVPNVARDTSVEAAMSNSFGFGGVNYSVVVAAPTFDPAPTEREATL